MELAETKLPLIPFHTFLWKISSRCNINCTYCYVYNSVDDRWRYQPKLMSADTARRASERMLEHLKVHAKTTASIVFHGGEPLMGGVKHLSTLVGIIRNVFEGSGISVNMGVQTNLLLLNEEIADFLLENRISVGVSLDGPPEINDHKRIDKKGGPTSARLERKLELLLSGKYRPLFGGFLCVIDPETSPESVVDYLLGFDPIGIDFLLPLNNHERLPTGKEHELSATPYGAWLTRAYDRWLSRPNETRVRTFQSIINMLCGASSLVESIGLNPVDLIVIESNGDLEGVDSLKTTFNGATELGFNVYHHSFDEVARHFAVQSRQMGAQSLSAECQRCGLVKVCGGGYLPHRYAAHNYFDNPSVYCSDLKMLIGHIHQSVSSALHPVITKAERRASSNGFSSSRGMAALHAPVREAARKILADQSHASVLDLGCGTGLLAYGIARDTGAIPFGIEIDAQKAKAARRLLRRAGGNAWAGDIFDPAWNWTDQQVDLVIVPLSAYLEMHTVGVEQFKRVVQTAARHQLVYAYDDDLKRFGSLTRMAELADINISGDAFGEVAALVHMDQSRILTLAN